MTIYKLTIGNELLVQKMIESGNPINTLFDTEQSAKKFMKSMEEKIPFNYEWELEPVSVYTEKEVEEVLANYGA
jgi:hypothetical protein